MRLSSFPRRRPLWWSIAIILTLAGVLVFRSLMPVYAAGFSDSPQVQGTDYYGTMGYIYSYDGGYDAYIADDSAQPQQPQVNISNGDVQSGSFTQAQVEMTVQQPQVNYPGGMGSGAGSPSIGGTTAQTGWLMHYDKQGENVNNGYGFVFAQNRNTYLSVLSGVSQGADPGYYNYVETPSFMPVSTIADRSSSATASAFNITDVQISAGARYEGDHLVKDSGAVDGWDLVNYFMASPRPWANLVPPSTATAGDTVTLTFHAWDATWYTGHHYVYIYATAPDGTSYPVTGSGTNMGQMTQFSGGNSSTSGTYSSPKTPSFQDNTDSIKWTIPNTAPGGTYTFHVYLRDELGRAAANFGATTTLSVKAYPTPTITISANPTALDAGNTSDLDVHVTNIRSGDTIVVSQSSNVSSPTVTSQGNTFTTVQFQPGLTADSYDYRPTATYNGSATITYTATLLRNGATVAGPTSVSVTWTQYYFTLKASQTSLDSGQSTVLTATTNRSVPSNSYIVIHDMSGDRTLNGSNAQPGALQQQTASATATDNQTQTVTYQAAVVINGTTYYSNQVQVQWATHQLTLSVSSATAAVGGQVTLTTNTDYPVDVSRAIFIHDTSGNDSLSGSNVWQGPYGQQNASTQASDSVAETDTYQAVLQLSDGSYVRSNTVQVTWVQNTFTLTVNQDHPSVGTPVTLSANTTYPVSSSKAIFIHDQSGDSTLSGPNPNVWQGPYGINNVSTSANDNSPQTVTYVAAVQLPDGTYRQSNTVTVTWGTVPTQPQPTITLSANTISPIQGQKVQLTTATQNVPTNGYVTITDNGNGQSYTGGSWSSPETSGSDSYTAYIHNSSGTVVATSNTVSVAWNAPPAQPGISLDASDLAPPYGVQITLTAIAQNVPSGGYVTIHDRYAGIDYTGTSWMPPETSGTQEYTAYIHDSSGSVVATSNVVDVVWGGSGPPASITLTLDKSQATLGQMVTATVSWANLPSSSVVNIFNPDVPMFYNYGPVIHVANIDSSNTTGSASVQFSDTGNYVWSEIDTHQARYIAEDQLFSQQYTPNDVVGSSSVNFLWIPPETMPTTTATSTASGGASSSSVLVVPSGTPVNFGINAFWVPYDTDPWHNQAPSAGAYVQLFDTDQNKAVNTAEYQAKYVQGYPTDWNGAWTANYGSSATAQVNQFGAPAMWNVDAATVTDPGLQANYTYTHVGHYQPDMYWNSVYDKGNTVTVIWQGPLSVSVSANPTSCIVGNPSTITASISGTPASGSYIEIYDQSTKTVIGDSAPGAMSYSVPYTENVATTDQFTAYVLNAADPGYHFADSSAVSVTWSYPAVSVSLSASPSNLYIYQTSSITASVSGTEMAGDYIEIYDQTSGEVLADSPAGAYSLTTSLERTVPETDTIQAYGLNTGIPNYHRADAAPINITWSYPSISISLTASPTNLYVGRNTQLTAQVSGAMQIYYTLEIKDATTGQIVGTASAGATQLTVQYSSPAAETDTFEGVIVYGKAPQPATSNPVQVTWYRATISLSADNYSLQAGQPVTFTATASQNVSGTHIEIWDLTNNTQVGTGLMTQLVQTYVSQQPATDTFAAYIVDDTTGNKLETSNILSVGWGTVPITLSGAQVYHTLHWAEKIQVWNYEYPSQARPLSDFWAGEQLNFRISANPHTAVTSAVVTVPLRYDSYVPAGAPPSANITLTYNAQYGDFEGNTDPNWGTYLQYLVPGTYQATFTVQGNSQIQTAIVPFTITGPWTNFWRNSQVY